MKLIVASFAALGLFALVGCNTSPPGGSGSGVPKKATFDIKAPSLATVLKQGETKEVKIAVERGKDFHDAVDLAFEPANGLSVDPTSHKAASDEKDVAIKVTAAKDAPLGDQTVRVIGKPPSGSSTSVDVKIKVEKSDAK
jgi:hypothetical protein